jgi:hypothetical protein
MNLIECRADGVDNENLHNHNVSDHEMCKCRTRIELVIAITYTLI